MKPRIGVLGCGYWGENHIRSLHTLGVLHGVADKCETRSHQFSQKYKVRAFSPEEIVKTQELDALVIALPPQFHVPYASLAIEHGKDVLVEKPIALDWQNAKNLVALSEEKGRLLMVGHVLRFHPAFEKLLSLYQAGSLGDLRYISGQRLGFGKFHEKSDALWDLAPHDLSLIFALLPQTPAQIKVEKISVATGQCDTAHIHLNFSAHTQVHLEVSRLSACRRRVLNVVGTKAIAVFDDMQPPEKKLALFSYTMMPKAFGGVEGSLEEPKYQPIEEGLPLTRELEHFIHCIETRQKPNCDGQEALAVLSILCSADC